MTKFFLALFIFLPFMTPAYALKIHNGVLLNSKVELSDQATGEFQPATATTSFELTQGGGAKARAKAFSQRGSMNTNVAIHSTHSFFVVNRTRVAQYYTYYYQLTCNGQFIRKIDNIRLEPNGIAQDAGVMYLNVFHGFPGSFPIVATTNVAGESSSFDQDSATLTIKR